MARNKLAKLLIDDAKAAETTTGTAISKFGLKQLTDIAGYLKHRIERWDPSKPDYDPLFEIAKIAYLTDDENLQFRCHSELARYQYPQIRSLEVQAKEDKEIKIKVELAGYAKSVSVGEIEDFETEEDQDESAEAEYRYVDNVLKQAEKKDIS